MGTESARRALTPIRVEIPVVYLLSSNILRAHCWDTDRVESALWLVCTCKTVAGRLRKVLATGDGHWRVDGQRARAAFLQPQLT